MASILSRYLSNVELVDAAMGKLSDVKVIEENLE